MTNWWQKPAMRRDAEERKVGFIELFYDLIFVVVIAQLAHDLAKHPDLEHVGKFGLLFTSVWWLWIGNTFYTDRFETNDVSQRLFTFLQMIPVVGLAVFAHDAFGETPKQYALAYIVGSVFIICLWWRGGYHDKEATHATNGYVVGYSIGLIPWVASLFVEAPLMHWLWALGLVINMAVPLLMRTRLAKLPAFGHSRLAERFGLFTIIVLGESVAGTVNGLAGLDRVTGMDQLTGFLAMTLAFLIWWIYFEMVPRESLKPRFVPTVSRSFLHLPLLGAIAASGAAVLSVVGHGQTALGGHQRLLLSGSVALAFACMLGLSRCHDYSPAFPGAQKRTEISMIIGIIGALAVGLFGVSLGPVRTIGLLCIVALVPLLWGIWAWSKIAEESEDQKHSGTH